MGLKKFSIFFRALSTCTNVNRIHLKINCVSVCGGIIDIYPGQETTITTPNYPDSYNLDTKCVWLLRVSRFTDKKISVSFYVVMLHYCFR